MLSETLVVTEESLQCRQSPRLKSKAEVTSSKAWSPWKQGVVLTLSRLRRRVQRLYKKTTIRSYRRESRM